MRTIITHENEWWWGKSYTLITNDGLATIELCVENNEERNYYGTIQSLMVHPSVRRKGLGNVMLKFAEEKAKELGLQQVVVVARKGTFLIPWYQRCGYEIYDDNVKESEGRTAALNKYFSQE
jgi:N-acetylglutamate synthase-like GNAT family acetyltransferase